MNNNIPINWTISTSYKAMHETKSPHVNHIHQHKSHNTIDLDLQSLYSISIKRYYNDSMQQAILSKLQANKWGWELTYLYKRGRMGSSRRAHHMLKHGQPSVKARAAKCEGRGRHLSSSTTSVKPIQEWRRGRHFKSLWAATSKGRHLSKRGAPPKAHMLNLQKISNQSQSNQVYIVPFDLLIDFALKFSPILSPFILFFIFTWLILLN